MNKRLSALALTLTICLAAFTASAGGASGWPLTGLATRKLAARSGPGAEYSDAGEYDATGETLNLYTCALDENGVCWVQADVPWGNQLRRLYTEMERFDESTIDTFNLMSEDMLYLFLDVTVVKTSPAMYGPGDGYDRCPTLTVERGMTVTYLVGEKEYALVEFQADAPKPERRQRRRCWVPQSALDMASLGLDEE